ncbi:hypothetical protein [Massilia horti]|uniref:DUF3379 domain-containing protein n=1 Tax=Massilia horti TaxID=2562153 RepID=A0A4Y9SZJ7_9BURK|nr:hypothetical protein [Massilia horti]TFW31891.1 hypothetical protein E4O92_11940 [Massilia horti]
MSTYDMNDPLLASPFDALRNELAHLDTPPGVEKELMQAFARQFPRKKRWYHMLANKNWAVAGSVASVAIAVMVIVLAPHLRAPGTKPFAGFDDDGAFIALESLERIEQEPAPQVVEAELPRTVLAQLGVPISPENAGGSVKAEMLVSGDGQPLAVRLTAIN